jgi:hypothetical protein
LDLDTTLIAALVTAVAAVLAASMPNYFGKRAERNDKIRDKKIAVYDELSLRVIELILEPVDDLTKRKDFILAYARAMAYADNTVIEACDRLITGLFGGDPIKGYLAISEILEAIRNDLNPKLGPLPEFLKSGLGSKTTTSTSTSNTDTTKKEND